MIALLERRWVRYPLFLLIGFITFFVALIFAFPDTEIKDIIEVQAEKALKHKYQVKIEDVDLYWLTGLELHNVELSKINEKEIVDENLPEVIPMRFNIPEVSVRLAIFRSIINFAPAFQFHMDVGGGSIDGTAVSKKFKLILNADIGPIDLRKTPAIAASLGVPFFGDLQGDIDMVIDQKLGAPIEGTASFKGDKITFGPATVKTDKLPAMAFIEVPQTNLGNLVIDLAVESKPGTVPQTVIKKFTFGGRDMRGDAWGYLTPMGMRGRFNVNVDLRVQFDTQYVTKNSLGPLFNISKVRAGKNKDWYGFSITGQTPKVRFNGNPAVANGPQAAPTPAPDQPAPPPAP